MRSGAQRSRQAEDLGLWLVVRKGSHSAMAAIRGDPWTVDHWHVGRQGPAKDRSLTVIPQPPPKYRISSTNAAPASRSLACAFRAAVNFRGD
jgi:hypothetical protein